MTISNVRYARNIVADSLGAGQAGDVPGGCGNRRERPNGRLFVLARAIVPSRQHLQHIEGGERAAFPGLSLQDWLLP